MDTLTKYNLQRSLGYRMTYVARLNERRFEGMIADHDLSRLAWCVLCALDYEDLSRPSDIADFIGVDRAAISRIIGQMEGKGLITRRLASGDARARAIEITVLGQQRLARGTAAAEDNAGHMRNQLTSEEYAALDAIMTKLMKGVDSPLKGL